MRFGNWSRSRAKRNFPKKIERVRLGSDGSGPADATQGQQPRQQIGVTANNRSTGNFTIRNTEVHFDLESWAHIFTRHVCWDLPFTSQYLRQNRNIPKLVQLAQMNFDTAVRQAWSIKGSFPTSAKVIIGRIEPWRDGIAVHVSVVDISPPIQVGEVKISEIAHMPFEKSALVHSLDRLLATGLQPSGDFEAGYKEWKERNGGIYSVSLAAVLNDKKR